MMPRSLLLFLMGAMLCACQGETESEYYGNLLDTPSGLVLVQEEHEIGWGEAECSTCHIRENYHQVREDRESDFDMEQIQEFVQGDEPEACVACHGSNGVEN